MLEKIKNAFKKTFSIENLLNGIRNVFSKKNLIRHFIDAVVATLIMFTFFGEYLVGWNLHPFYLIIVLAVYAGCATYKWLSHLQDRFEEEKEKYQNRRK